MREQGEREERGEERRTTSEKNGRIGNEKMEKKERNL